MGNWKRVWNRGRSLGWGLKAGVVSTRTVLKAVIVGGVTWSEDRP